mgnify:CR=1 FL=1
MNWRAVGLVAGCLMLAGDAAQAQTMSAYQVGLGIAQQRGYANAGCYAEVFARHAVVVERSDGRRGWNAASTPAYNAEQRRRCGVDRLADIAERRQARSNPFAAPRGSGNVNSAGLRVAAQRGYQGEKAACFARTYAVFASPQPNGSGRVGYAIAGRSESSYSAELYRACGITR